MWNACKPILVGVTSPVSEILLHFCLPSKRPKFPFGPWTIVHGGQKIELAQKIHASRGWPEMHANQFWWAWLLRFRRFWLIFRLPSKRLKFPFRPWTIVHGGQKIELAQKIHASRGWCETHANQFWWVWLFQFRRFCFFYRLPSKQPKFPFRTMDYSPWGSKNRIGSKNSCK